MRLLIGTTNNSKIEGAKNAFMNYFDNVEIEGINVSSEVANEPVNDQIYTGAKNRVNGVIKFAKEHKLDIDYYLGIESGIINLFNKCFIIHVAVIIDKNGYESTGISSCFPVPNKYVDDIIKTDLSSVMHTFNKELGTINQLTNNIINRTYLCKEAFIMALTQYINKNWSD